MSNAPTIFISYSHDSKEYREQVLGLSERLRADGLCTELDQYIEGTPPEGWPRWMLNQLDKAHHVLVICTEIYYRRFRGHEEPDKGKGVDWEGALISQEIYDDKSKTCKFVPVLFKDQLQAYIPEPLRSHTHYVLDCEANYQALYDFLLGQAGVEPGAIGTPTKRMRRKGLPSTFDPTPDQSPFQDYYQSCLARWSDKRFALDQRFVNLTLLIDQGENAQGQRWQTSQSFSSLNAVLQHVLEPAIVVLGAPGCGKSTLLRHYEWQNAQRHRTEVADLQLTFFLPLNSYKSSRPGEALPLPKAWLAERWQLTYPDLPDLESLLKQRRVTLLLDALNEMPTTRVEAVRLWKDYLHDLAINYPGNRVIFSCRTLDYSASLSSKELRVPQVRIEPLSNPQVKEFIDVYCPQHSVALWQKLEHTPQLEMLRLPYFLKLLMEQAQDGNIPAGRAALFTGFVRQALQREVVGEHPLFLPNALLDEQDTQWLILANAAKMPFKLPERGRLIPKLGQLAYQMQNHHIEGESGQVRIADDVALDLLDDVRASDIVTAGIAIGVLEHDLDREEVLYIHQLLQEYFAARVLAKVPQPELVQQTWQAELVTPSLQVTLAKLVDSDPLPPLPGTGWEETTILAVAMAKDPNTYIANLMLDNLVLAGRCAAQPDVSIREDLKIQLRWALVARTQDPNADLRVRIAAGLALGHLGDPRFERRTGPYGDYLLPPLITIPAGIYTLGSEEGPEDGRERPVHKVELKAFQIGQFPVTNAEWQLFMQAGGYDDERWWDTAEAQAWQCGESTAEGLQQQWRENRTWLQEHYSELEAMRRFTSQQIKDYRRYADMSEGEFEAILEEWYPPGRRTVPGLWHDEAFNNPAQPVVSVCWHEARAYCNWLSAQTQHAYRLPTEAEWEAAARGFEARRYAYGDDFVASRCNTFQTHIRRTTPVGVFPGGETPQGIVDMSGNTWDWTSSLYQAYPYVADDGREQLAESGRRVLRGGSWSLSPVLARAPYRRWFYPVGWYYDGGFRVVCCLPFTGY